MPSPSALAQAVQAEIVDDQRQAFAQRQSDFVDQRHRRRAGTAFGTVDGNEIGRRFDTPPVDFVKQFIEPAVGAHHRFESDRPTGDAADPIDHRQQFVDRVDIRVAVGADRILTHVDTANLGDFRADLGAG